MASAAAQRCNSSPGAVEEDETLALGLYSPSIFNDATGELTTEAITVEKLATPKAGHEDICGNSTGLSVNRIGKPKGREELDRTLETIVSRPTKAGVKRKAIGHATISVAEVTKLGEGKLFVVDDGCECNSTHAVVRSDIANNNKSALRGIRNNLVSKLNRAVVRHVL